MKCLRVSGVKTSQRRTLKHKAARCLTNTGNTDRGLASKRSPGSH